MKKKSINKKLAGALSAITCISAILAVSVSAFATESEKVSPASLWTVGKGISVQENFDLPDYMTSGYQIITDKEIKMVTKNDLPEWRTNGIKVTSNSETSKLEFNNVINVSNFTKEDVLFEFAPLSSFRVSTADFTGMKVWVTDADDETNWFCLDMWAVDAQFGGATRMCITNSKGISAGYRWGTRQEVYAEFYEGGRRDFYNAFYRTAVETENGISSLYDVMYEPLSIRYDAEDKAVYVTNIIQSDLYKCILDMDDTANVGLGNEFEGFKNGRVKIAFQTYNISSVAEYVILNIGNNALNGTNINDEKPAEYLERLPKGGVPVANVGKPYKMFDVEFYDAYDGVLPFTAYVKSPNSNDFTTVDGDNFIPEVQGDYVLRYVSVDNSGNERQVEYVVSARYAVPSIELSLQSDIVNSCNVGETITFPQILSLTGGSGPLEVTTTVERVSDGAILDTDGKSFIPYVSGNYVLTYTASDYVGNVITKSIVYHVQDNHLPVRSSEIIMYKRFIDGVQVILPEVEIYDYSSLLGQRINAKTTVTATSVSNPSVVEEIKDYIFKPTIKKFGDKVIIRYSSKCTAYPNEQPLVSEFEVELVDAKHTWDYVWADDGVTVGYNTQYESSKYVSITSSVQGDVSAEFINPLRAEEFEFQFNVDKDKDRFDYILLTLTDFIDSSKTVTVRLEKKNTSNTYVIYNGVKREMTGGFGAENAKLLLTYSKSKLYDNLKNEVASFDGFNGFPSGKVWVKVTLVNANPLASVKLVKIGNQSMYANYRKDELQDFKDSVAPTIEFLGVIPSDAEIFDQVTLPSARAYSACSPYVETYVSLTYVPLGSEEDKAITIIDKELADKEHVFTVTGYGKYTVTYSAKNAAGRTKNFPQDIKVSDLGKPVIVYGGESEISVGVGNTKKFPEVKVFDAVDQNPVLQVFVINPNGVMTAVTESMSYKFTTSGRYTLRYYAYDSNYNYSIVDVKVMVK